MTLSFLKNKKARIWGGILLVVILILGYSLRKGNKAPSYESMAAKRGELIQEVSVTGKIKPAQAVDLQFESSGRIAAINYKVGDKVNTGAVIASLENQDLQAAVSSAKADLEKTKRNYSSLSDPSVSSSLRVELENAKSNLEQVTKKADGDLLSKYSTAFSTMREAMTQIDTSSAILEYIRKAYLETNPAYNEPIKGYQSNINSKVTRIEAIFPEINQSGVVITSSMYSRIDSSLQETLGASQLLLSAFNYLQNQVQSNPYLISSSTDRASINTEASAISSDVSGVSSSVQGITDQRILNTKNISDAQANLASTEASFPTTEDILQKEATLLSAQSQLRKSLIVAPFAGIVGKIDVERGQTVSSSIIIVSLVSSAKYQIEANITEVDIGKVSIGNPATLTLDAYGSQVVLKAKVSSVDTSATVVEGVTTYKTVFDFDGPVDENIRPNMTANIDIQTAKEEDVISIPQRAVVTKNGVKIVRIYHGPGVAVEERTVQLGMSGKDGYVEVISGLSEGDQVITFVNE